MHVIRLRSPVEISVEQADKAVSLLSSLLSSNQLDVMRLMMQ